MANRTPALSLIMLVAACSQVEPVGSGTLLVDWQVSPSGCEDAGVVAVEVRASGPHALVERFACDSLGAVFDDVTPGTYRVELFGFDASGQPIFVGEPTVVDVEADVVTPTPTIRLLASPAQVDVRWTFSNGRVCGANGARWITIGVFDDFDYEVATAQFSCDDGEGRIPPLRAGNYLLEVNALDEAEIVWRGVAPLKVGRAEKAILDVELELAE